MKKPRPLVLSLVLLALLSGAVVHGGDTAILPPAAPATERPPSPLAPLGRALSKIFGGAAEWAGSVVVGSAEELGKTAVGAAEGTAKVTGGTARFLVDGASHYANDTKLDNR